MQPDPFRKKTKNCVTIDFGWDTGKIWQTKFHSPTIVTHCVQNACALSREQGTRKVKAPHGVADHSTLIRFPLPNKNACHFRPHYVTNRSHIDGSMWNADRMSTGEKREIINSAFTFPLFLHQRKYPFPICCPDRKERSVFVEGGPFFRGIFVLYGIREVLQTFGCTEETELGGSELIPGPQRGRSKSNKIPSPVSAGPSPIPQKARRGKDI